MWRVIFGVKSPRTDPMNTRLRLELVAPDVRSISNWVHLAERMRDSTLRRGCWVVHRQK